MKVRATKLGFYKYRRYPLDAQHPRAGQVFEIPDEPRTPKGFVRIIDGKKVPWEDRPTMFSPLWMEEMPADTPVAYELPEPVLKASGAPLKYGRPPVEGKPGVPNLPAPKPLDVEVSTPAPSAGKSKNRRVL